MQLVPSELLPLRATVRAMNQAMQDRSMCYYCAEPSACEDHVIPHSLLCKQGTDRLGWQVDTLPACQECNAMLGARVFDTLTERKAHLARKLRQRYAKEIQHTPWTENELIELGDTLRGFSRTLNAAHERITLRLAVLEGITLAPMPAPMPPLPALTLRARDIEAMTPTPAPVVKPKRAVKPTPRVQLKPAHTLREPISAKDASRWVQDANGQWDYRTER